jgi:hypothetical protein
MTTGGVIDVTALLEIQEEDLLTYFTNNARPKCPIYLMIKRFYVFGM